MVSGNCRRLVGCVLLVLVAYGATVEVAHSHGLVAPDRGCNTAMSDGRGGNAPSGHSHHGDCTTCQFQQQLFNGIVQTPLLALKPSSETALVVTLTVFHPSTSATPTSDRAPPFGLM